MWTLCTMPRLYRQILLPLYLFFMSVLFLSSIRLFWVLSPPHILWFSVDCFLGYEIIFPSYYSTCSNSPGIFSLNAVLYLPFLYARSFVQFKDTSHSPKMYIIYINVLMHIHKDLFFHCCLCFMYQYISEAIYKSAPYESFCFPEDGWYIFIIFAFSVRKYIVTYVIPSHTLHAEPNPIPMTFKFVVSAETSFSVAFIYSVYITYVTIVHNYCRNQSGYYFNIWNVACPQTK